MQHSSLALAAAALCTTFAAQAHTITYRAVLDGPSESPPNASPGSGTALVTFDLDLATMRVQASFADLIGTTTASHIHCCTADSGLSTAGVATQTPSFVGFPSGATSGSYDHSFDLADATSYNAAFIAANGGTVSNAMNALLAGAADGKAYLNIHTSTFPGGEIRGFLAPVPEPSSYALMALGLAALGAAAARHRSRG